jgi:RpiR family carbohydrate utilization transcriptional regulator
VSFSVRSLANRLNFDPATTARIVRAMSFAGCREFQRFLHELSIAHATSFKLVQASSTRDGGIPVHVRESLEQESRNLEALRTSLEYKRMEALARRVYKADRILLIGGDLASTAVAYFEYHLAILGLTVLSTTTTGRVAHLARNCSRQDLVFAVGFGRGLRQTVESLQEARARGAYCVGLMDTFVSPIARFADECSFALVHTPSFGDSYVAPITLSNVMLIACAGLPRGRTLALLKQADHE